MNFRSREADISALDQFRRANTCPMIGQQGLPQALLVLGGVLVASVSLFLVYFGKLRGHAGLGALLFALVVGISLYRSGLLKCFRS